MRQSERLLPIVLAGAALGACQTSPTPYAPVQSVRYAALGQDPFWMLTIGDDRIVLRQAGDGRGAPVEATWPRTLPRTVGGVTTWESGEGTAVISVESRPGPCTGAGGRRYEDHVRVRLSGRELNGCGGRLLAGNGD